MRREFFTLTNASEMQRSSATLNGTSGRQRGKGASRWRRRMQKVVSLHLEVDRLIALFALAEDVVVARQHRVQQDADQRRHRQTRQADGHLTNGEHNRARVGEVDAQRKGHNHRRDDDIAALEDRLEQIDKEMAANATNAGKLRELSEEQQETQQKLDEKMDRWVYLNDLAEQIEAQKE